MANSTQQQGKKLVTSGTHQAVSTGTWFQLKVLGLISDSKNSFYPIVYKLYLIE